MVKITVDTNKCNGDGICVDVCPSGVFELNADGKSVPVNPDECIECMACVDQCPENAITVEID